MRKSSIVTHPLLNCFGRLLIVVCLAFPASGQVENSKKFRAVPAQLRERLVERFNLYVECERTRQYEKLFDLLSQDFISNQHLTREGYLQSRLKDKLVEFKLRAVTKSPVRWIVKRDVMDKIPNVNVYEIIGIAKFQRGAKVVEEERHLEARLQDNDWYFTDWLVYVE